MRILLSFLIASLLIACGNPTAPEFTHLEIKPVFTDSLSIRAIAPLDENRVWFAANKGMVGLIDKETPKLAAFKYGDSLLQFRAIATTKNTVFVLSVANPGVLYKIGFDSNEATAVEEVYVEKGEKVFYDAMAFWNDKEGIAMGDPTEDCLSVIMTEDGGSTWKKLPCSQLPKTVEGEAAFAASNSNIALYGNHVWIATGGIKARVFHSPDKGKTWEVYATPIIQGKVMTGIYSIDFYDESVGVIFGGNWDDKDFNEGNKAITTDGGKTWNLISNGKGPGYRSSVRFVPGTKGNGIVAVGSPGISYSNDRGESWIELSSEGFYAIEFVNDTVAFASGPNKISKLTFKK
ncbi:BNR/Asp-box repeat protein [Ulvibacter sp. MAR_2010_11]|uniref:WD40/YVTN/BNR-like repeat-containing protein n=1 Tax=Ulvibacter sp. MAR_2010_11 TaxID=1250229 RepID=UPI000C2B633B|nr:oxidoreductase [Ulvibacter sp. MAR_2010_11]PKA83916.1 BNR/Asp-box repeat protein [Ulvibacter sp. MAR_2010_11]